LKAAITRLIKKVQELRENRRINKVKSVRKAPNLTERKLIFKKTDGKCHICGGNLGRKWHADHVLPHASGGHGVVDNFLGSCAVCNGARWFYTPEEIRFILKLGGLSLSEIRKDTKIGRDIARKYIARERLNKSRRK
jgi:5-methylcytosine-specific restriction endonuclease McrA